MFVGSNTNLVDCCGDAVGVVDVCCMHCCCMQL
jgi:hypothetical protein